MGTDAKWGRACFVNFLLTILLLDDKINVEVLEFARHGDGPAYTPHPSAFGCHFPLDGKAWSHSHPSSFEEVVIL